MRDSDIEIKITKEKKYFSSRGASLRRSITCRKRGTEKRKRKTDD